MPMSPQQAAFKQALIDHPLRSILLEAVAGSGKTTTIINSLDVLKGPVALLAFNKKIADELDIRVKYLPPMTQMNIKARTSHSFGLEAYKAGSGQRKPQIQGGKLNFLLKDLLADYAESHPLKRGRSIVKNLVSFAKNNGFGVKSCDGFEQFPEIDDLYAWQEMVEHYGLEPEIEKIWGEDMVDHGIGEVIRLAQTLLRQSNAQRSMIDFDDMIYLPLLLNYPFPKFAHVVTDEAQDTNVVRREMAFRMLRPEGRMIIVGDRHQAIYGFTGADAQALDNFADRAGAIRLPLTVCFRCDDKIIASAQEEVPHIEAHNAGSGKGLVESLDINEDFFTRLVPGDAILCRLNKPNIAIAIALLRRGKTPRIEGRDFGQTLLKHVRLADPNMPALPDALLALEEYKVHQVTKLLAKDKEKAAAFLEDEVEACELLIERCLEQGQTAYHHLEALVNLLFVDEATRQKAIILSSIHKSKGLEWPRVYILGYEDFMPFHLAKMPWELEQERNLSYVAKTRAEHDLILVNGVRSFLDRGLHRVIKKQVDLSQISFDGPVIAPDDEYDVSDSNDPAYISPRNVDL